jgi:hypothetical protein
MPAPSVQKIFSGKRMGSAYDFIHKLLDHTAVTFHIPHIHAFGNLIPLHGNFLHHQVQPFLQAGFLNMTGQCKFKTAVCRLCALYRFYRAC